MWLLNRALGRVVDLLLFPFRDMPAVIGLAVVSLIVSVAILWVYRAVSDQGALDTV
jgi:hypothetical protein